MKPATMVTQVVLAFIAVLHTLRLILRVPVVVNDVTVPVWASIPGAVFFGALAFGLWRDHRTA